MSHPAHEPILTLEPLIEAVRAGVEDGHWTLSGLQKTTSHEFEGRWEGESTRSAYLFFHPGGDQPVSIDVLLDETGRGLGGNLALVVDLVPLRELGDPVAVLGRLGALAARTLPAGRQTPLTLRARLADGSDDPSDAEIEVRFKLRIPRPRLRQGHEAVRMLCVETVAAFMRLLEAPELVEIVSRD